MEIEGFKRRLIDGLATSKAAAKQASDLLATSKDAARRAFDFVVDTLSGPGNTVLADAGDVFHDEFSAIETRAMRAEIECGATILSG